MTDLMDVDTVIAKTTSVLLEASQFAKDPNAYRTGVFGRSQVIHHAMSFLVSWVYSNQGNEDALFSSNGNVLHDILYLFIFIFIYLIFL